MTHRHRRTCLQILQRSVWNNGVCAKGGLVDEDDYLWFVGSSNDVIKSSEYRNAYGIGPFEVGSIFFDRAYMCA